MARYEVTYITKGNSQNTHECITHIWGTFGKLSVQQAIQRIENCQDSFYVDRGGSMVDIIVSVSSCGNKYLKTNPDEYEQNNLLSLPEAPISQSSFLAKIASAQLQLLQLGLEFQKVTKCTTKVRFVNKREFTYYSIELSNSLSNSLESQHSAVNSSPLQVESL